MGYTIAYGVKNLTPDEIKVGIEYVRTNVDTSLFQIAFLSEDGVLLEMAQEPPMGEPGVEGFVFPPPPYGSFPYNVVKTNEVQPHDKHLKDLMGGLEKLLPGKFAATDRQGWFAGSYDARKEIGLE
jgi:hypothetical protein